MRTRNILVKDAGESRSKNSSKPKKPYQKSSAKTSDVNEPKVAAYAPGRSNLHAVRGRLSKKGSLNNSMENHSQVRASKNGIHFSNDGRPVHKISFNEKLDAIENGFTKKSLLQLRDRYGITSDTLATILNITNRTIQGKSMTFKFTGNVAEKILGLSEVYSYGIEVFGEEEKFKTWLKVNSPVLGSKRPLDLLSTQLGMQQVQYELARIDYGIY